MSIKIWNSTTVRTQLEAALGDNYRVTEHEPGGDFDTKELRIHVVGKEDDCISISGFNPEVELSSMPDDWPVECVVISNFQADSRGGLQTTDTNLAKAYAIARKVMEDWSIYNHYHDFM